MHPHTCACKHVHALLDIGSWSDRTRTCTRARLHARDVCSLTTRGTLHLPLILNRQERARAKPGQGYKRRFTAESRRLSRQLRADVFDWRKILSRKQGVRRRRQPVNEAARRTASGRTNQRRQRRACLDSRGKSYRETSSQEAACGDRQRKKLTGNQAARRMACGVNRRKKPTGEQGVRRAACGTTKQRGDGGQENGCNMGEACSNRRETGEFHSHY